MNDLIFLDEELSNEYEPSNAILKAVLPGGKVIHISDHISPSKFLDTCPLLYHTFEYNSEGRLQASIEASSDTAVVSLARYCYTGNYLASEPDEDNILLLQHAETYKIAEDFDVPELQIVAHGNFSCQIEYACCLPKPPQDLLDTIRFIYRHFASDEARREHNLVDTLLNYCVAVYLYHKLGESLDFLTAVHEISAFRQDLCRTNIARNFEDECAADIVRLPSGSGAGPSMPPTILSSRDLPKEMLYDEPRAIPSAESSRSTEASKSSVTLQSRHTLAAKPFQHDIPDSSKHSVSPSALTAALEKYTEEVPTHSPVETATEQMLRKYKLARFAETEARLGWKPVLPEGGPSSGLCAKERGSPTIKTEPTESSGEESYWEGTFRQTESRSSAIVTEGTSHSARRLLFEYGRRDVRSEQKTILSLPTVHTSQTTALPHRLHNPNARPDTSAPVDTTSDDEGFAMVHRPEATADASLHSPMSSPELVPAASIAQTIADDKITSEDDWTML